jgi:propionyl-CoA carboxylase beta chain
MGAQGAVNILYRKELAEANNSEDVRKKLITEYDDTLANPYLAAERGFIDAVIEPQQSRILITRAIRALQNKKDVLPYRKHGNIPL